MSKRYWFFDSLKNFFPEIIAGFIILIFYLSTPKRSFWHHPGNFLGGLSLLLIISSLKISFSYSAHNLAAIPAIVLLLGVSGGKLLDKFKRFELLGWLLLIFMILFSNRVFLSNYWQRSGSLYKDIKNIRQLIMNNSQPDEPIIAFDIESLLSA